jgi:hypothetical protein
MLMHLQIPQNTSDQPIDLMNDDEYVFEIPTESELMDSLDDAILNSYRAIWS